MIRVEIKSELILQNIKNISFDKEVLSDHDIISLCKKNECFPPWVACYKISYPESILFICDPLRSIPIFYCIQKEKIWVSDCTSDLLDYTSKKIDPEASLEFLHTGYTTGQSTLLTEIKQLGAGEYLWIHNTGVKTGFYQRYLTEDLSSPDPNILENGLRQLLKEVFSTLVEKLQGRTAIIPLSGGYDSRLIVYWLYQLKYPDIICVTYGRTNNIEIENAQKTAQKLGLPWHFIDYTQLPITKYLDTESFHNYYPYMANHSSMFFMQDFFAVKYLKENNIIPSDAVFIPGHSGDFLAGSHLSKKLGNRMQNEHLAKEILDKHYNLVDINNIELPVLLDKVKQNLPLHPLSYLNLEDWELRERQAKFIVNSARIFNFFGYEYFLPLWDNRLIEFFRALPFQFKLHKKLYNQTVKQLFEDYGLNFTNETQATPFTYELQSFKQLIINYLPIIKKLKQLPVDDSICYREITSCMVNKLKNNNVAIRRVNSYNGYIVQWYLNKINT